MYLSYTYDMRLFSDGIFPNKTLVTVGKLPDVDVCSASTVFPRDTNAYTYPSLSTVCFQSSIVYLQSAWSFLFFLLCSRPRFCVDQSERRISNVLLDDLLEFILRNCIQTAFENSKLKFKKMAAVKRD